MRTSGPSSDIVRARDLGFAYGQSPVLHGVDVAIERGEIFGIIGPSGTGKTTLLSLFMGLSAPASGELAVSAKRTALVFQKPQLFPWRTALENAAYGLECRGEPREGAREKARALLVRLGLGEKLAAHPHQLSEGMKQRVNLARALLVDPDLLLMDEPYTGLDVVARRRLQDDLLDLVRERELTVVFASHALDEVVYLCDRVAVLAGEPATIAGVHAIELARPRSESAVISGVERLRPLLS